MKKLLATLSATILCALMAASAGAQLQQVNLSPGDISTLNEYLNNHTDISQLLVNNPQLVNDPQFLRSHPQFQEYLSSHPGLWDEMRRNPGRYGYRDGEYQWMSPELVKRFNRGYLDEHPEVAHQLASNPGLVDNPQFLATHPGLDQYLSAHPNVRAELQAHPYRFMNDDWRYGLYGRGYGWGNPVRPGAVARFDNGYLDQHPEVAQQLAANPRLADNPQFLATHPGLDRYLDNHPEVRSELQHHPEAFMHREARYENYEEGGRPHPLRNTDRYLDNHPEVKAQLEANPGLVDDPKYVREHPGLHHFMENHPVARHEMKSHPYRYMSHEEHYDKKHPNQ
jgi:phage tail protein X